MKIQVRTPQISRNSWVQSYIQNFEKKVSFFQPLQTVFVKNDADLLRSIEPKDWVIACDERGKRPTSREFALDLQKILESGKAKLHFIVGGPFGLNPEVKQRADQTLSLSHFVFNQELALAVLYEQIFRGLSILNNHPYHND